MKHKNKKKTHQNYTKANKINTNINANANTNINTKVNTPANTSVATKTTDPVTQSVVNKVVSTYKYTKPVYTYKGRKNQTEFPGFVELCKMTQKELIKFLPNELMKAGYTNVIVGDGYIYAKGTVPVLLTAHMDTVHKETIKDFYEYVNEKGQHVLSSPQGIGGDDRCGIYMILDIIKKHKCSVLFCEDEESGGIGSRKFCKTEFIEDLSELKYLIELDRMNGTDAVFYDCDNAEFTQFIEDNTGYKEAYGSFSDISNLAPECMVAAVNLSCGYYHAHTLGDEVVVEEMLNTIKVVKELLTAECEQFVYEEAKYSGYYGRCYNYGYGYYGYGYGSGYAKGYGSKYYDDDDDDYDWDDYDSASYAKANKDASAVKGKYDWYDKDPAVILYVEFYDGTTYREKKATYCSTTEEGAWFKFFKDNPDTPWNCVIAYEFDYA